MNDSKSIKKLKEELRHWEKERELHREISWIGSKSSMKRIYDLEDSHLLNIIKNMHDAVIRANNLPYIQELQQYEGYKYTQWLAWLTAEYNYRKTLLNLKTEQEYENWQDLNDLINNEPPNISGRGLKNIPF